MNIEGQMIPLPPPRENRHSMMLSIKQFTYLQLAGVKYNIGQ